MREEYDISALDPKKNPHVEKTKRQVTMKMHSTTIEYFKDLAEETGMPYQTLISFYLDDCAKQNKKLQFK